MNHLAELAEAHLELGNHARAEDIAVEALQRYRAERDQFALVEMLRVYGMVLARQQRWGGRNGMGPDRLPCSADAVSLRPRLPPL